MADAWTLMFSFDDGAHVHIASAERTWSEQLVDGKGYEGIHTRLCPRRRPVGSSPSTSTLPCYFATTCGTPAVATRGGIGAVTTISLPVSQATMIGLTARGSLRRRGSHPTYFDSSKSSCSTVAATALTSCISHFAAVTIAAHPPRPQPPRQPAWGRE